MSYPVERTMKILLFPKTGGSWKKDDYITTKDNDKNFSTIKNLKFNISRSLFKSTLQGNNLLENIFIIPTNTSTS